MKDEKTEEEDQKVDFKLKMYIDKKEVNIDDTQVAHVEGNEDDAKIKRYENIINFVYQKMLGLYDLK